jgi:hypothetical protein
VRGESGVCNAGSDYEGSRIRVRFYNGKVVEAEITAITNQSAGGKMQIVSWQCDRVD